MARPTIEQLEAAHDRAIQQQDEYSGNEYVEAVADTLRWVLGYSDSDPTDWE